MLQGQRKYKNKKVVNTLGTWDSKKELQRFLVLKDAEEKGIISDLQRQVKFELIPAIKEECIEHLKTKDKIKTRTVQLAINYTADFCYYKDGVYVVEDVKASPHMLPKEFSLKAKLFFWKYRKKIRLVYNASEEV